MEWKQARLRVRVVGVRALAIVLVLGFMAGMHTAASASGSEGHRLVAEVAKKGSLEIQVGCGGRVVVNRAAIAFNSALQILRRACHLDGRLVHPPVGADGLLAGAKNLGERWQAFHRP